MALPRGSPESWGLGSLTNCAVRNALPMSSGRSTGGGGALVCWRRLGRTRAQGPRDLADPGGFSRSTMASGHFLAHMSYWALVIVDSARGVCSNAVLCYLDRSGVVRFIGGLPLGKAENG